MDMWKCPTCTKTSFPADGQNGRPNRKAYVDAAGAQIKTDKVVYYCANCAECFEGIDAPVAPEADRIRKPTIDSEGVVFGLDGVGREKLPDGTEVLVPKKLG